VIVLVGSPFVFRKRALEGEMLVDTHIMEMGGHETFIIPGPPYPSISINFAPITPLPLN